MLRKGTGDEGPRPIADEELEAVAGGASFTVTFGDGCRIGINGVATWEEAESEALYWHEQVLGHECNNYRIVGNN